MAGNQGMVRAFEEALQSEKILVPDHYEVMGAISGIALLARDYRQEQVPTRFKGFDLTRVHYHFNSFECTGCSNGCEVFSFETDQRSAHLLGGPLWPLGCIRSPSRGVRGVRKKPGTKRPGDEGSGVRADSIRGPKEKKKKRATGGGDVSPNPEG